MEIENNFTDLHKRYTFLFNRGGVYYGATRTELMQNIASDLRGVYIIRSIDRDSILYIGSSGKIGRGITSNGASIRQRIFCASTPYYFSPDEDVLLYSPTSSDVPPTGYESNVDIGNVSIEVIPMPEGIAPSVLEGILIQGHINEFGDIPTINRKI